MLNTSLALDPELPVPELAVPRRAEPVPSWTAIKTALTSRPELAAVAGVAAETASSWCRCYVIEGRCRVIVDSRSTSRD